jgi:hypothetical protein
MIREHWPTHITVRGDSHYARPQVMDFCDEEGIDFVFGLAGNDVLRQSGRARRRRCAGCGVPKQTRRSSAAIPRRATAPNRGTSGSRAGGLTIEGNTELPDFARRMLTGADESPRIVTDGQAVAGVVPAFARTGDAEQFELTCWHFAMLPDCLVTGRRRATRTLVKNVGSRRERSRHRQPRKTR